MTPVAIIREEGREAPPEARLAAQAAAAALESRDGATSAHCDDVVILCRAMADRLGIRGKDCDDLIVAAKLHDVGKVGVPLQIIEKRGPLDESEWSVMR